MHGDGRLKIEESRKLDDLSSKITAYLRQKARYRIRQTVARLQSCIRSTPLGSGKRYLADEEKIVVIGVRPV